MRLLKPEETAALREPSRLASLALTGLMDTPPEEGFDRLARLAARLLQAPLGLVNLLDERRQFSKSCFSTAPWSEPREAPLRDSYCKWAVVTGEPVVISDARTDERVRESAFLQAGMLSYLGIPLSTHQGDVLGTLCVADFRPREWTAAELELLSELAALAVTELELRLHAGERTRVERMKGELVSVVAHEFRTPLTAIRGSLGLLASGRLDPTSESGKRMIAVAADSSERLVRLINEMLDLERLEAGAEELRRDRVDAGTVLRTAADVVSHTPEGRRVRLIPRADPGVTLDGDADRIVQVLVNIAANAARYSEDDGTVELSAERRGAEVLLTVKDRGRGIPPDKLESIFERFSQADSSDARERGGVGLGLAICRSIVRQHGGRIWVASEVGRGSTFFFTIPARI